MWGVRCVFFGGGEVGKNVTFHVAMCGVNAKETFLGTVFSKWTKKLKKKKQRSKNR